MTTRRNRSGTPLILTIVGVAAILVWAGILFLHAWYHNRLSAEAERKVVGRPATALIELRGAQKGVLTEYGWIDRERGVVKLPIARAMELVVAESGRGEQ